jgi:hypothetical protein
MDIQWHTPIPQDRIFVKFYTECSYSSAELLNRVTTLLQEKGLYIRPPYIPTPIQVDFVHKQNFLTGWFGDRRPLNTIEIMNLFFNLQRNAIGNSLLMGFAQVAKKKEIQNYFKKGMDIATKHVEIFGSLLREDELPAPQTWDTEATNSTVAPFSDKLMIFHALSMNSAGIGYYGASMGTSQRRDVATMYSRIMLETAQYAEDGANLMIDNGWLEQPPTAADRDALMSGKKKVMNKVKGDSLAKCRTLKFNLLNSLSLIHFSHECSLIRRNSSTRN